MFGSVRGGNYGAVGQQINKQNQYLNEVNMKTSPDYGKIANESIKGRSRERQAAIQAEAQVAKTGLDMKSQLKAGKIELDAEKAVRDIKRPAKRMAGVVAAAGALGGAAVLKKFNDEAKARDDKRSSEFNARIEALRGAYEGYKPPETPEYEAPPEIPRPELLVPEKSNVSADDQPTSGTSQQTEGTLSSSGSSSSSSSSSSSGSQGITRLTQAQIKAKFKARGFDDATAHLWSAIAMQESSGRVGAHNDGTRTNTDENSHGILQINTKAHMDKLKRRGWSVADLKDPDKNIDIAIEVFNEVGGKFTPWGGYTDGGYKKFI